MVMPIKIESIKPKLKAAATQNPTNPKIALLTKVTNTAPFSIENSLDNWSSKPSKNNKNTIITRFKGLGEMPSEQLKNTTMNINKRKLIKITQN